ncbi:TolB family protein [Marinilabilia salmonicolor]|uniref:TolB family protein n=1 Tax=Marinilabilia salmonicolor TaxID=989 RepID=UPI00029ABC55|nr:PD40 domain-containing protein [Marinilabilia salmonicolor]
MKGLLFSMVSFLLLATSSCVGGKSEVQKKEGYPEIFPDYIGVTIPSGIAPLNFRIEWDSVRYSELYIENSDGKILRVKAEQTLKMPLDEWKHLLETSKGDSLMFHLDVNRNGEWYRFSPFPVYVSGDPIDYGLSYRLIAPGYEIYSKMGIYQRSLDNFNQNAIVENTLFQGSCMNCHSYRQTNAANMSLHIRGPQGGTVLLEDGNLKVLDTKTKETLSKCVYPYWHPTGNYIAYSVNKTQQTFHAANEKRVEVFDHASDIVIFDVNKNTLFSCDHLQSKNHMETFPAFSPDGKSLFFCSARVDTLPLQIKNIKYNLMRIDFDPETGMFGSAIDTLFNAAELDQSVSFPRPSYDGRFIVYTKFNYGNFSIWHPEADLWLYDTETGINKPLETLNSDQTESYHSWSSNSRWMVFSSRRVNGLYTMPFIAHIDEQGNAGKPFLLPQEDPDFYDMTFYSFNVPEFINQPVNMNLGQLEEAVKNEHVQLSFEKRND